jgi:2-hydroxy-6-oxonona-2,4-dienedioate hydrolase
MMFSELEEIERASTLFESQHKHGKIVSRIWGTQNVGAGTIVLLHGSFGAWSHWAKNISRLAHSRKVVAIDLPGMGDSDQPPDPISADSMGKLVAESIEQILSPREIFQLVGFSFGGIVGGQSALILEDRIDRFVVIGSNALDLPIDDRAPLMKPSSLMTDNELREVHRHNLGVFMFGDKTKIDDMALDLQSINTRKARTRSGLIPHGGSLKEALKKLRIPVLGIWGEKDATAGRFLNERRQLFESLPHCQAFTVITGAGHWAAYEEPDKVNAILLEKGPH